MKLLVSLLVLSMFLLTVCDQNHTLLELEKPHLQEFTQMPFTGKYLFNIKQDEVKKLGSDKWYFFVEVEPDQSKEWIYTQIDLSVGKKNSELSTPTKKCDSIKGGVDSCFLTNKQFNYVSEQVHVKINCRGPCKFKLSASISTPYKISPGKSIRMDFQNTAYSKIFTLDTKEEKNFDQLRIILRPDGFLQFPAPIRLYVNQDQSIPTKQRHDLKGMTLWDNGQGIFLDMPDAKGFFTILVEGPEKNVLMLQTQLISFKQTNQIPQNLPFFDYLGEGSVKKYKAKVNPSKGACFQMTTFSGGIKLLNILDENLQIIQQQFAPLYRSYGELQYQLDSKFFSEHSKFKIDNYIVFEIQGVKQSTFVLEAYQLDPNIAHLLPQRTRYVEIPSKKYHQYYVQIVELNSLQFKKAQFQIIMTTEQGVQMNPRFFNCKKEHGAECQLKSSEVQAKSIKNKDFQEASSFEAEHPAKGVSIYKFSVLAKQFQKASEQTQKYILVILVENKEDEEQLYTIQFINSGKSVYLKQGQVKTDRVAIDQSKYYSFTNSNKDVKEIRVHVMQISGRVFVQGFLQDPRKSDLTGQQILDYHNAVRFPVKKENDTIYLKVTGKQNAYYSIQLQLLKESEMQWWNKTHQKDTKAFNEIIIVENINYEFNLKPKSKEVFQIHSKTRKFNLDINSLLPVELCMTQELKKAPFSPNCEVTEVISKNKYYEVTLEKGEIGNIGVTNNNDKEVRFNIRVSNKESVKPIENNTDSGSGSSISSNTSDIKCLPGILGKINKYNFKSNTSSCYSYQISTTKYEDLEVIADIVSDQYDKVNIVAEINNFEKVQIIGATHIFEKEELKKACEGVKVCSVKIFVKSLVDTEIRLTAQFTSGTFFLLDGIAHQFAGSEKSRNFVYELYNKVNTTVVLQSKNSFYKFYGKIVDGKNYWAGNQKFPSKTDKIIESTNPFYFMSQISILTQAQIKDSKCQECLLLLTVVKQQEGTYDRTKKSKFVIECTQQTRFLKENTPVFVFLNHKSVAFYQFYNSQNGSILVTISSQNQECVNVYMKKGLQRASNSIYDKQAQSSESTLVFQNAEAGDYSIALQATDNCYFSVEVTTSSNGLSTINLGNYKDLKLDKHEQAKFIYEHTTNQTIKILTLHVNGQITIKAKQYLNIKDIVKDDLKKIKYDWSGQDFLNIQKSDKKYCTQCAYLIVLEAQKQTKTSIMLPQKDSQFPIVIDSYVKDELKKDEVEILRIFTQKIAQFQVSVQYGSIKIEILTSATNDVEFSKVFQASQAKQYQNVSTTPDKGGSIKPYDYAFMRYNRVRITAIKDAGFSFGFISDKQQSKRGNRVKYGVPEYVNLSPKKSECLRGMLDDSDQQFLISITGEKQFDLMNNLQIECTVDDNKLLELSKDIAKNQMIVKIQNNALIKNAQYEFCMTSKESVFLTFIHSSRLNYFPESQVILVSKEMNLSFYSEGRSLLQINQCKSRAIVSISRSFNNLGGMNSQIKQVRRTNNIIEFSQYGPVFIHVQAVSATISWRKKSDSPIAKFGLGYDEYTINKIRVDKVDRLLNVNVFPLKKVADKPQIVFTNVEYTAFIAQEEMNLYDAMNCNQGTYLQSTPTPQSLISDTPVIIKFNIDSILEKFRNKRYVLVGVLAKATAVNQSNYRFIYSYQQILTSALNSQSNQLKEEEEHQIFVNPVNKDKIIIVKETSAFNTFVLYFALVVIVGFFGIWVYRKWIKKMLRKRRQQLSEQGTGQVRYQEFSSSDR